MSTQEANPQVPHDSDNHLHIPTKEEMDAVTGSPRHGLSKGAKAVIGGALGVGLVGTGIGVGTAMASRDRQEAPGGVPAATGDPFETPSQDPTTPEASVGPTDLPSGTGENAEISADVLVPTHSYKDMLAMAEKPDGYQEIAKLPFQDRYAFYIEYTAQEAINAGTTPNEWFDSSQSNREGSPGTNWLLANPDQIPSFVTGAEWADIWNAAMSAPNKDLGKSLVSAMLYYGTNADGTPRRNLMDDAAKIDQNGANPQGANLHFEVLNTSAVQQGTDRDGNPISYFNGTFQTFDIHDTELSKPLSEVTTAQVIQKRVAVPITDADGTTHTEIFDTWPIGYTNPGSTPPNGGWLSK